MFPFMSKVVLDTRAKILVLYLKNHADYLQ